MSKKLYHERDVETLDDAGGFYFRHVMAMTSEQLHSKSDIAAELGFRDMIIDELESKLLALQAERDALRQVCAEAYQMAGAIGAPVESLDNLSAAANGDPIPHETFLPIFGNQLSAHDAEVAKSAFIAGSMHRSKVFFDDETADVNLAADKYVADLLAKAGE